MESYSENKGEGSEHFKALERGISLEGSLGRSSWMSLVQWWPPLHGAEHLPRCALTQDFTRAQKSSPGTRRLTRPDGTCGGLPNLRRHQTANEPLIRFSGSERSSDHMLSGADTCCPNPERTEGCGPAYKVLRQRGSRKTFPDRTDVNHPVLPQSDLRQRAMGTWREDRFTLWFLS